MATTETVHAVGRIAFKVAHLSSDGSTVAVPCSSSSLKARGLDVCHQWTVGTMLARS
eukprot:CAMPEP_0171915334 /NCGR_PEP_ID=MMETSP0993-20121228/13715_1 /TAXON_ID=483369 /ORGANISM="non described non described, Strain CCMP2098" /LENGTH=56 /DNA_ID=CAMNT_0012550263 /DNA_START=18 /DNA_END=188 /DNA_ORIENTATION=+